MATRKADGGIMANGIGNGNGKRNGGKNGGRLDPMDMNNSNVMDYPDEEVYALMRDIIERHTRDGQVPTVPSATCTTRQTFAGLSGIRTMVGLHFLMLCNCHPPDIGHYPEVITFSILPDRAYEMALALWEMARAAGYEPQ